MPEASHGTNRASIVGISMLRIALLLAVLLLPDLAGAQQVSARINWYGVYFSEVKEIIDERSPTGKRFELGKVTPPANSDSRIIPKDRTNFGFEYVVSDGSRSNVIEIEEVYFLPNDGVGKRDRETGEPQYRFKRTVRSGEEHVVGWWMGEGGAERVPLGAWVIEIHHRGRVIATQRFFVERR
jgi:hypothetical protein